MQRAVIHLRRALASIRVRGDRAPSTRVAVVLRGQRGQTTAEYALVLLGAAGVALLLLGWATQSGAIGQLFDIVMAGVIGKVK